MTLCTRLLTSMHVIMLAAALVACGDDDTTRPDSGPGGDVDSGPGTDSGPGVDGGGGGRSDAGDSGTTGRMCGAAGGVCDVIAQDCPNSTDACYYASAPGGGAPTTMCVPVIGTGDDGDACDSVNDCLPGLTCSDEVCRRYCCGGMASDCPSGSGQFCVGLSGAGEIGQCTASADCTLVAPQTGCAAGQGCYIARDDGTLGCFGAGTLAEGAACENLNSCVPGTACLSMGAEPGRCTKFCRISEGEGDCSPGRMCAAGVTAPADIGICPAPA